jgi:hypothetical protein
MAFCYIRETYRYKMKNVLTKQRPGMLLFLAFFASATLLILSCKKERSVDVPEKIEPEAKIKLDSFYVEIAGKPYSGKPNIPGMNSVGNSGYRMKYLDAPREGMTIYTEYGDSRKGWYAATDSIYFTCANTYKTNSYEAFEISFSQGFHKSDMNRYGNLYFPIDTRKMLKKGKLSFATDYQSTNSKNGVSVSFATYGGTGKDEFAYEEPLANYPQDDSVFEIINTEQIDKESYFVEARFTLNLYDKNRTKHRVSNGYIRFTLSSNNFFGYFYL